MIRKLLKLLRWAEPLKKGNNTILKLIQLVNIINYYPISYIDLIINIYFGFVILVSLTKIF